MRGWTASGSRTANRRALGHLPADPAGHEERQSDGLIKDLFQRVPASRRHPTWQRGSDRVSGGAPLRDSWLGLLATPSAPILTAAKENVDTCAQPVVHVLRSDCQQISAHPSERNAWWMSARLSYRTRKRRN
jgi:hypothetical protein